MERIDTYRRKRATGKAALLMLALALAAIFFYASPGHPTAKVSPPPTAEAKAAVPEDKRLWLTVPEMARVEDLPVLIGPAGDEAALAQSALHVAGTGLPWQEEANVYIAGHRIGFEGEASHLVFYDLDALRKGDEVILTDADGTRYAYRVFSSFVVGPSDYYVTEPTPGRNIVSLQTCTPVPTLEERLVVQAELANVAPAQPYGCPQVVFSGPSGTPDREALGLRPEIPATAPDRPEASGHTIGEERSSSWSMRFWDRLGRIHP